MGVDLQQQRAKPVDRPGRFPGGVVVVASEYFQRSEDLAVSVAQTQHAWHPQRGHRDHERVSGIGFRVSGQQLRSFTHRKSGQVSDLASRVFGAE